MISTKNVWGIPGGMEIQRADLWTLDLQQVLNGVRAVPDFSDYILPSDTTTPYYATQVVFPEVSIEALEYKVGNDARLYPGYNQPVNAVRVDFMLEAAIAQSNVAALANGSDANVANAISNPSNVKSVIFTLLECWKRMVEIGRSDSSLKLPENATNLSNYYKFDIDVSLYRGLSSISGAEDAPEFGMELSKRFTLKAAWVQSLQISSLDYKNNTPLIATAMIVPSSIRSGSGKVGVIKFGASQGFDQNGLPTKFVQGEF